MTTVAALDVAGLSRVLLGTCDAMTGSIEILTHADQAVGDGDHGLAIGRGFRAARVAMEVLPADADLGGLFDGFGMAMLTSMGGASGAIYGTLFRRGARPLKGLTSFDGTALAAFLEGGLAARGRRAALRGADGCRGRCPGRRREHP